MDKTAPSAVALYIDHVRKVTNLVTLLHLGISDLPPVGRNALVHCFPAHNLAHSKKIENPNPTLMLAVGTVRTISDNMDKIWMRNSWITTNKKILAYFNMYIYFMEQLNSVRWNDLMFLTYNKKIHTLPGQVGEHIIDEVYMTGCCRLYEIKNIIKYECTKKVKIAKLKIFAAYPTLHYKWKSRVRYMKAQTQRNKALI
ncbi:hypothetical protein ACJX0J_015341 [Zea mays]